jgi:iduronate 2-sulfatase
MRRAYYAAVAYHDYNIGQLLDTLDELDVAANTVAVVFGDHGWQVRVAARPPGRAV